MTCYRWSRRPCRSLILLGGLGGWWKDVGEAGAAEEHEVLHGGFHGPGSLAHAAAGEPDDEATDVVADRVDPLHQSADAVDEILFLVDAALFAAGSLALLAPAVLGRLPGGARAHRGAGAIVRVPREQGSAAGGRGVGWSQGDVVGDVGAAVDVAVEERERVFGFLGS